MLSLLTFFTAFASSFGVSADTSDLDLVKRVQNGLTQLGYKIGPIDGIAGAKTIEAIRDFERNQGMAVSGKITPALTKRLPVPVYYYYELIPGMAVGPNDPPPVNDCECQTIMLGKWLCTTKAEVTSKSLPAVCGKSAQNLIIRRSSH